MKEQLKSIEERAKSELEKVLDMKKSSYAQKNGVDKFKMDDLEILFKVNNDSTNLSCSFE